MLVCQVCVRVMYLMKNWILIMCQIYDVLRCLNSNIKIHPNYGGQTMYRIISCVNGKRVCE
jgi:hypothetical protein